MAELETVSHINRYLVTPVLGCSMPLSSATKNLTLTLAKIKAGAKSCCLPNLVRMSPSVGKQWKQLG